jgi:hypothetical protein
MVSVAARDVSGCRILIPPSGGSNPPAPATHSANVQTSRHGAESPAFCGPLRARRLETDGTCRAIAILRAGLQCRFSNLRNLPGRRPGPVCV